MERQNVKHVHVEATLILQTVYLVPLVHSPQMEDHVNYVQLISSPLKDHANVDIVLLDMNHQQIEVNV